MDFYDIVRQVLDLLQRDGRTTYRALKRQFGLDEEAFEDLKEELLYAHPVTDDADRGLVWTGDPAALESEVQRGPEAEKQLPVIFRVVTALLRHEKRVTYQELRQIFGIDKPFLEALRRELTFKQLARDEHGEGLVWTGEAYPGAPAAATARRPHVVPHATDVTSPSAPTLASLVTGTDTLEATHSAPVAERRQLTVMFCDLADSTKLSQKLDPEDLREVVRAYQATAAEVIEQYEGHMAQYLGDGLLIYFGWPVAHEDDAQRALHAGLDVVEAITTTLNPRLQQDKGVQLNVRLGVHTGPVVVGEMGSGKRHENLATGETVNIAARLEGLATPNTILISNVTARLTQDAFALDDLGPQVLKGIAEPINVFQVLEPQDVALDDEGNLPDGGVFLVGRDEEIGLLIRRWQQSKEGLGQVVLISGEAGIGKSSLVTTVRQQVRQEGYTCMTFRCSPYHTNSALYPMIEFVQRVLDFQAGDTPATRLDKLERGIGGYSRSVEDVVPLFADLLSVPIPEGRYAALRLSPQQQRQQTQDMLVGWLLEEAERHPTLAMWEDLHWADPSTLETLGLVLAQTPTVPMLHVLTHRPEFEPPWPSRSHMTPITLNRLERPQVETLITHLAAGKALPDEVIEHIVVKTDGVPLYVEELTKMLLASDLLCEEAKQYVLIGSLLSVAIPDTLQDSLMARLDQMQTAKEVAQLGAVLGREFSYDLLRAISSQNDKTLQSGLTTLVEAELLYQRGRPPRARYIFKHALIQDVAYASLLKSHRQQVHQRVAQLLEVRFPELIETQPELVAHHCTEAGQAEAAIRYWQQAGQRALQRSAHAEAIAHLRQGLALLTVLPGTPMRLQLELDFQVALGPALLVTKGNASPDAERAYARARELCQQLGDTPQLFPVLRGLVLFYSARGQLRTAHQLGEQLLHLAQSQSETAHILLAHYQLGMVLFFQGEPAAGRMHHTQALAIYTPQAHRVLAVRYGTDLGVVSHSFLALELWQLGYPEQALAHSRESRKLAREVSHPFSLAQALGYAAILHQFRHEAAVASKLAVAETTLATEQSFANWLARGMVLHGWALSIEGQCDAGIAKIHQGLDAFRDMGGKTWQPYFLGMLAEAYREGGQPEEGLQALDEALVVRDQTQGSFYAAELYRLKGELLLSLECGARDAALTPEACFYQAMDIARQQQAKSWELRAATSLARLWQSKGKRQEAYELLAPVYGWFTEGFDTADLREAHDLLAELA